MLAARAKELLEREASVGCTPDLAPCPVQLEPPFRDLIAPRESRLLPANDPSPVGLSEDDERVRDLRRYQVWVQTDSALDWTRAELFLRQLHPLSYRAGLEFAGNAAHLALCLVVHQEDVPVLWAAFRAWQPSCELSALPGPPRRAWQTQDDDHLLLRDYYPPPPYSHRFTCPEELRLSPLEAILAALMEIRPPSVGLYQVLLSLVLQLTAEAPLIAGSCCTLRCQV